MKCNSSPGVWNFAQTGVCSDVALQTVIYDLETRCSSQPWSAPTRMGVFRFSWVLEFNLKNSVLNSEKTSRTRRVCVYPGLLHWISTDWISERRTETNSNSQNSETKVRTQMNSSHAASSCFLLSLYLVIKRKDLRIMRSVSNFL